MSEHEHELNDGLSDNDSDANAHKTRERKSTEKGREYNLQVAYGNYRKAFKRWRRQLNRAETALLDTDELSTLRTERNNLDGCFDELANEYQRLEDKGDNEIEETTALEFDNSEDETQRVSKAINSKIADLLVDDVSSRSSTRSSRSQRRLAEISVKAARLDTELKFREVESAKMIALQKQQEEIERLRLEKELALMKAEIDTLNNLKEERASTILGQSVDDGKSDKSRILSSYLEEQLGHVTSSNEGQPQLNDEIEHPDPDNSRSGNEELSDYQDKKDGSVKDKGNPTPNIKMENLESDSEDRDPGTEDSPDARNRNDYSSKDKVPAKDNIEEPNNTDDPGTGTEDPPDYHTTGDDSSTDNGHTKHNIGNHNNTATLDKGPRTSRNRPIQILTRKTF